jgi:hypothetical protein
MFENRLLRRMFGPKRDEENGGSCTVRSFIIFTRPQILLDKSNQRE